MFAYINGNVQTKPPAHPPLWPALPVAAGAVLAAQRLRAPHRADHGRGSGEPFGKGEGGRTDGQGGGAVGSGKFAAGILTRSKKKGPLFAI